MKTTALGSAIAVTLASMSVAHAAENPFAAQDLKGGYMVAEAAAGEKRVGRDMAGNEVVLPENFEFGGDNTGAYAGGKIGTGAKDPAVCGTFTDATCSIEYVKGK
ncbi:MAG: hypothetical protein R3F45_10905 [Gammaproteobacteria bacterium]